MKAARLLAPAKLTLSLRVTGVRDDGFHFIDAEMVTLDLFDIVDVDPSATGVRVSDESSADVGAVIDPHGNLVIAAMRLAGVDAGVTLTKNIPAGAGLGGGSADAAALLRWAGYSDVAGAAAIGADVAFCLLGGRARVGGIGDVVEALPFADLTFTIVTPKIHCSTPEVYRMWDDMGGPTSAGTNDLEAAALRLMPELAAVRDHLGESTGKTPRLAGSGSSWFVEGDHPEAGVVVRTYDPSAHHDVGEGTVS